MNAPVSAVTLSPVDKPARQQEDKPQHTQHDQQTSTQIIQNNQLGTPVQLSHLVEQHIVKCSLPVLAYIPHYLSEAEEARILQSVNSSRAGWTLVSGRKLQNHGGVVHAKGLLQTRMPDWLSGGLLPRIHIETGIYGEAAPNHVLVNHYKPGEGIMPHQDGPAYWPAVAIVSLGAPAVIRFWPKQEEGAPSRKTPPVASLLLMPRSLLVFTGDAYNNCLHGIHPVTEEMLDDTVVNLGASDQPPGLAHGSLLPRNSDRVSLTVRRVVKVVKNVIRLSAS